MRAVVLSSDLDFRIKQVQSSAIVTLQCIGEFPWEAPGCEG